LPNKNWFKNSMSGAEKMKKGIIGAVLRKGEIVAFLRHSFYYYAF